MHGGNPELQNLGSLNLDPQNPGLVRSRVAHYQALPRSGHFRLTMETAIMMEIEVNASYGVIHFYICCFAFVWRAKVSVRRTKAIEGRVEANAK